MQFNKTMIDRRAFLASLGGAAAMLSLRKSSFSQDRKTNAAQSMLVYIGTYTSGKSKSEGIYIYKLDLKTGALSPLDIAKNVIEPSYLVLDHDRRYLYSVNETVDFEGKKSGAVSSFAVDQKSGRLEYLSKQASLGGAPCHLSVTGNGRYVLAANYVGGNVAVLPSSAGKLRASVDVEQHIGTGPNAERQESAHAHSITLDMHERFAVACDLGADKIFIYKFDVVTGKLAANPAQPFYQTKPGAGPRHFAFHPNGNYAFVINELDSTITSLRYDATLGTLREIVTVSTLPNGWVGENTCADLHISPDGKFLYGSNRGHDSIVSYMIDANTGMIKLIEHVSTQGKTPRNFAIDPTGNILLAANQNSDSIVTFFIDRKTGKLAPTGNTATVPTPVCLKLTPAFS